MAGLQNGVLFALIALGYTLVYGIIELINFAHGDLFMIGTLVSGFIITSVFGVTVSGASVAGWLYLRRSPWWAAWRSVAASTWRSSSSRTGGCDMRPSWRR